MGPNSGIRAGTALRRRLAAWELTPLRITLLYLCAGFGALYLEDVAIPAALSEPLATRVQAVKGGAEVVVTGGLIYVLTRRSRSQLRETNETLQRQREELDVLHRVLRHNLRNALTTIAGRAEMIQGELDAEHQLGEHCEQIRTAARDIVEVVEQASRIRRITAANRATEVELTETVSSVLAGHPAVGDDTEVGTDLPPAATAAVNPLFEDALAELVGNAIEHSSGPSRIELAVERDPSGTVEVTVADDGPGIDEHVRSMFERGDLDQLRHLDGMGLWFVYWTVIDSGGDFAIEDNEWGGTTIRITLPAGSAAASTAIGFGPLTAVFPV
jgi:signal transduction histidine kinase